jgi:hypothetical protein
MRPTVTRRTAAVAASALWLALVAGCTGSGSDASEEKDGKATSQPAAGKPLSATQLEKAALTTQDVDGYSVEEPGEDELMKQKDVKADKEACAPIAHALSGVVAEGSEAEEHRQITSDPKAAASEDTDAEDSLGSAFDVTATLVSLASYEGPEQTEAALKSLSEAVDACTGGFGVTVKGGGQKVTKVKRQTAPKGSGDEVVAVTLTAEQAGRSGPMKFVVVRQGSTLAYFTAVNLASLVSGKDYPFPTDLVEAQLAKLG